MLHLALSNDTLHFDTAFVDLNLVPDDLMTAQGPLTPSLNSCSLKSLVNSWETGEWMEIHVNVLEELGFSSVSSAASSGRMSPALCSLEPGAQVLVVVRPKVSAKVIDHMW